ncbi:phosphoenolpyruvate phosphomutase-domain-containing protein [Mycena epipterygia]|nr:phosphoenolpyruvate phosphomutase-domain-containing protein [Mycena epipterygia]
MGIVRARADYSWRRNAVLDPVDERQQDVVRCVVDDVRPGGMSHPGDEEEPVDGQGALAISGLCRAAREQANETTKRGSKKMVATSASPLSANQAKELKALHQPGHPIVFANIYDVSSLSALLSLNTSASSVHGPVRAIATAFYAIAETIGVRDEDLTFEQHFAALERITTHLRTVSSLPLSVDLQDGYGTRLEECMRRAVSLGAVGAKIEDSIPEHGFAAGVEGSIRSTEEQVRRIETALRVAAEVSVLDFVVNARTDVMRLAPRPEGTVEEAVRRGMAFLEAGATTVFLGRGLRVFEQL